MSPKTSTSGNLVRSSLKPRSKRNEVSDWDSQERRLIKLKVSKKSNKPKLKSILKKSKTKDIDPTQEDYEEADIRSNEDINVLSSLQSEGGAEMFEPFSNEADTAAANYDMISNE